MKIIWVSNGHGEDLIACTLITVWQEQHPEDTHQAMALVGAGIAYILQNIPLMGSHFSPPSAGFAYLHPSRLAKDLKAGLLRHLHQQLKTLKASSADRYIAVGDIVPLLSLSLAKKATQSVFIACALSDYYTHGKSCFDPLQIYLLKSKGILTFARDQLTANNLKKRGVEAYFRGNPMIDGVKTSEEKCHANQVEKKESMTLLILPGSHQDAVNNLRYITRLLTQSMQHLHFECRFICVAAPNIEKELKALTPTISLVFLPARDFGNAIKKADAAIGLAGTANEQCIARGLPVISFSGPEGTQQYTEAFGEAQQRLLGPALRFYPYITAELLKWQLQHLKNNLSDYTKIAQQTGLERFGKPDAHQRIMEHIRAKIAIK